MRLINDNGKVSVTDITDGIADELHAANVEFPAPRQIKKSVITSCTKLVEFGKAPILIGERINPTGKKKLKQALKDNDITYILNEGITQEEKGAQVLDVNVGLPEIDEVAMMETVVKEQDGAVAAEGQKDADELVKGSTVYDYLNKGKDGDGKLVLGTDSKSISIGKDSEATEDNSIAIGTGIKVHGKRSGAIGDPGDVFGDDSYVIGNNPNVNGNGTFVVGNNANVTGDTNFVLGHNANVTGKNNIVLGNDVTVENVDDAIVIGNGSTAEAGAVSVGSKDGERQIKHVAPGEDDTDAAE